MSKKNKILFKINELINAIIKEYDEAIGSLTPMEKVFHASIYSAFFVSLYFAFKILSK
jgi:hypothetical protein